MRRLLAVAAGVAGVGGAWWLLFAIAACWDGLGGRIDERARWLVRFAVHAGPVLGYLLVQDALACPHSARRSCGATAFRLFLALGSATAALLIGLRLALLDDAVGAAFGAFVGVVTGGATAFVLEAVGSLTGWSRPDPFPGESWDEDEALESPPAER